VSAFLPQNDPLQAPELTDVGLMTNAWDVPTIIKGSDNHDERTTVHPLPPLPEITLAVQPWYLEEAHVQEYQAAQSNDDQHHNEQPQEEFAHSENQYEEHHHHSDPVHEDANHHEEHNVSDYQESYQDDQQSHHQHEHHHHEAYHEPAPPPAQEREYAMLNWNPSWEEPPDNKNDVDIPDLQIYSNAWDYPQHNNQVWVAPTVEDLPPPPSMIDYHHQYIHHHQEVQEEHPQESTPYVAVFPWEEQQEYRPAPSRIWQDELERERRAREEAEWLRAEEEARVKAEEEARWRDEEERKRLEREQAAAQWNQREVTGQSFGVNNQQELIQQAMDAEAGIIEQTVSEFHDHQQPSTLDQPFVSVWDQMPSIKRYLALLGANEAFKKSEYQTYQDQEEQEQEEATHYQQEQELTTEDDDEEDEYEDEEEDEEEEEEEEEEEVQEETIIKPAAPATQANSWWGEPFAIDSMPTTPRLNKFGWRSPLMPSTPRLEDEDWDDRDLIPLPLKRTSRLYQPEALYQQEFTSPPKTTADIPKSNASVSESEGSVKQQKKKRRAKKPRKLFADEDDMLKRTPFASAVTTPTSEKSFLLPNVDAEADIINVAESKSFGEYKIEWASDLLKGSQAGIITPMARTPSREKEVTSYFEGAASPGTPKKNKYNALASRTVWDPLRALKSLKANGEKLLITTKLGGAEQGHQPEDVEDSDEEYAPAAYYDNDDEEDLGVLGLTFPKSRSSFGYALSKDDSPQYDSMTASPATPTAKGMTMNLTDKIIQEAVDRRASADFALHEAATSLVKSTEADDDGYAMSPVMEEFPGKNVSATELEMSSGDLFKRRASLETPTKEWPTTPSVTETKIEQPLDKQTSVNVDAMESTAESQPVQYDIVQAATEKLRQIAGVDWEAAAKEDSARGNDDVSNWVFAQQHEGVPSAQQTVVEEQPKDTAVDDAEVPSVPLDVAPEELAIAEEPVAEFAKAQQKYIPTQGELTQAEPVQVESTQVEPATVEPAQVEPAPVEPAQVEPAQVEPAQVEPAQVEPAQVEPAPVEPAQVEPAQVEPAQVEPAQVEPTQVEPAQVEPDQVEPTQVEPAQVEPTQVEQPQATPEVASQDEAPSSEDQPRLSSDLPKASDDSEPPKEPTEPAAEADETKSEARKVPGHLSLKDRNVEDVNKHVHKYDDLKTPTQATFVSGIHPDVAGNTAESNSEYSSEGEQSLPEDIKKNLVDTVEHLVRKVEAGEPSTPDLLQGTDKAQLMERETSMSNRDAQALSEEEITSYIHQPVVHPPQAHTRSEDPNTAVPVHQEDTERDEGDDDDLSDTQYLSATEGDHHSESGASADWFSVQSSNASDHSDFEDDQHVPETGNIHQEFLRRFGGFPQLNNELSSLDSWTPSEDNAAEEHSVTRPTGSTTSDDASDRTP
jgi:hypothetical protein